MPLTPRLKQKIAKFDEKGVLFIHIPKSGGRAVSDALYGLQVKHSSICVYQAVVPDLVARVETVSIVRDPVDRFVSAYRHAISGGASEKRVSRAFRSTYAGFRSIGDAIDHVRSARSTYHVGPLFRPQVWYLHDRARRIAVDTLFRYDDLDSMTPLLSDRFEKPIRRINVTPPTDPIAPNSREKAQIRDLYAADAALYDALPIGRIIDLKDGAAGQG
ncbi:sulfotransferase family 2 domain-containing protein [Croceicoccus naphthovorans]|uniref:Uncharacterized protein n=1 Tax=Croceicoccus naphthovorans TaxID=1348774 RepID=A0A0G3XEG3_9SPHN|nr:sulfotransferase family 2 domain-containing protein [Croceicoccus naphthovorans]AKM09552.1 hypothetical protein AB433_05490 [Croceicoccus naphthovorans]MBB3989687.1 hypothetical protein [Croceicoccus naphthovorans]